MCGEVHTYERTWPGTTPLVKARLVSTHLTTCARFLAMSSDEKMAVVMSNAACMVCAGWDHSTHKFPGGKPTRELKCSHNANGVVCGAPHGRWYHETTTSGGAHSVVASVSSQGPGLYEVYLAPVHPPSSQKTASGMVMVDPGSDTNFVRHDFATSIGLVGEECQFRLKVVDRDARPLTTRRYTIEVEDKDGHRHTISALGLDSITRLPPDPDFTPIKHLVEHLPPAVLDRPQGEVDILLGLKNSALHGRTVEQWGNLRLLAVPYWLWIFAAREPPRPGVSRASSMSVPVRGWLRIRASCRHVRGGVGGISPPGLHRVPGAERAGNVSASRLPEVPRMPRVHLSPQETIARRSGGCDEGGARDERRLNLRKDYGSVPVEELC